MGCALNPELLRTELCSKHKATLTGQKGALIGQVHWCFNLIEYQSEKSILGLHLNDNQLRTAVAVLWIMFVPYVALRRTAVVNMRSVASKARVSTCDIS